MHNVSVHVKGRSEGYEITIRPGALSEIGTHARRSLPAAARRIVLISNPTIFELYGDLAMRSLRDAGFRASSWLMPDGEQYKTLDSLDEALTKFARAGLERNDGVVSLGGGVVCDLAGFAAAIYMRGIAILQVPTTLLAQIDASIGGKTAINSSFGKNLIGAFHQPRGVLIDPSTLRTLPPRELTSGWLECIKHGAVGSRMLFNQTVRHLKNSKVSGNDSRGEELSKLIAAHCSFKARIVAGDEREAFGRKDYRSRRILNFGHSIAHALDFVTKYRRFRHGEAVGCGMLVAGELSKRLGILGVSDLESLRAAIHLAGELPLANEIEVNAIISALTHDKKSVGGNIQWILLERLGRARIVDGSDVSSRMLRASLNRALRTTK